MSSSQLESLLTDIFNSKGPGMPDSVTGSSPQEVGIFKVIRLCGGLLGQLFFPEDQRTASDQRSVLPGGTLAPTARWEIHIQRLEMWLTVVVSMRLWVQFPAPGQTQKERC